MKANELMIGDWVIDSTNCFVKFDGIGCSDYNEINRNNGYPIRCDDEDDRYVGIINREQKRSYNEHLADIRPIPITKEILEINGFRHHAKYECEDIWMYYDLNIEIVFTSYAATIRIFTSGEDGQDILYLRDLGHTRYVHELQNALRVCGYNKFADDFLIER